MIGVYAVIVEKPQSQGRVDCIVETPKYVYVYEFKLDGTADEALAQIEAKGYARPYAGQPHSLVHRCQLLLGDRHRRRMDIPSERKVNPGENVQRTDTVLA